MGTEEVKERSGIDRIIAGCRVCRLALCVEGTPYIVPLSFGYDGENLYFHTGMEGRKVRGFESGSPVCFEFESGVELRTAEDDPCSWSFCYQSVIGYGSISELSGQEKAAGLNRIMLHYSGREWDFDPEVMERTRVWKLAVSEVSGRISGE